jgi:predicted enzyme related to lactoylglutathione lyase
VDDLEAALAAVTAAGASIVRPIFAFPGGRRFQFLDPHGNELAVMQADGGMPDGARTLSCADELT